MKYFYSCEIVLNAWKPNIRDSDSLVFNIINTFQSHNSVENMFGEVIAKKEIFHSWKENIIENMFLGFLVFSKMDS